MIEDNILHTVPKSKSPTIEKVNVLDKLRRVMANNQYFRVHHQVLKMHVLFT